jgi:hypothetical protein
MGLNVDVWVTSNGNHVVFSFFEDESGFLGKKCVFEKERHSRKFLTWNRTSKWSWENKLLRPLPARHMLLCRLQCVTRAKTTDNMSPAGGKHPHPHDDIDCSVMLTSETCNRLLSIQRCFINVIALIYTVVKSLMLIVFPWFYAVQRSGI